MSKLTQRWNDYLQAKLLNNPDPSAILEEIWDEASKPVFFIAYSRTKDKIKSFKVTRDVFNALRDSSERPDNFAHWLSDLTLKICDDMYSP